MSGSGEWPFVQKAATCLLQSIGSVLKCKSGELQSEKIKEQEFSKGILHKLITITSSMNE